MISFAIRGSRIVIFGLSSQNVDVFSTMRTVATPSTFPLKNETRKLIIRVEILKQKILLDMFDANCPDSSPFPSR